MLKLSFSNSAGTSALEPVEGLIRHCSEPAKPRRQQPCRGVPTAGGGLAVKPRAARCLQTSGWETARGTRTCNPHTRP